MPWISLNTTDAETIGKTLKELEHDFDRAAGIVGAVLVDEALTTLLKSQLCRDQDLIEELFRASGPLGAFSVKINLGFLMGLYSPVARKELETIKNIRNEFAHYVARSFEFDRIKSLAANLALAEKTEFYLVNENTNVVLYIGTKPPPDKSSIPVLPPIDPNKLTPRERYLRSCQFFSGALLFVGHVKPITNPAVMYF